MLEDGRVGTGDQQITVVRGALKVKTLDGSRETRWCYKARLITIFGVWDLTV